YNIVAFLRELGYTVFAYNPFIIKQFAKSQSLRKIKTDKLVNYGLMLLLNIIRQIK
ncbi:degenerate transposase, partial [Streptococcus canis]